MADELVHIIMSTDATQYKTMFEQTRTMLAEHENDLKKKQDRVMELESKVRQEITQCNGALRYVTYHYSA